MTEGVKMAHGSDAFQAGSYNSTCDCRVSRRLHQIGQSSKTLFVGFLHFTLVFLIFTGEDPLYY